MRWHRSVSSVVVASVALALASSSCSSDDSFSPVAPEEGARPSSQSVVEPAADLAEFEEVELDDLSGEIVNIGGTRSSVVPVFTRRGAGESRLALIDVEGGEVRDAGKIPINGWLADARPVGSDRYVTALLQDCPAAPYDDRAGLACGVEDPDQQIDLVFVSYDLAAGTWATMPVEFPPDSYYEHVDTDGAVATFKEPAQVPGGVDRWATVRLDEPLQLGPFHSLEPELRPRCCSGDVMDGFGWKARSAADDDDPTTQGETLWTGTMGGEEREVVIAETNGRTFHFAGNCLAIISREGERLDHVHRVCAT